MRADLELTSEVRRSARVLQMAGMFDVPLAERLTHRVNADLPVEDRPWNVGLLVGPSGAGKSSLLQELWPQAACAEYAWSDDRALIDDFPTGMGVRDVVSLLTAVGLGSPPAWMRPYRTLSNGEAFRAGMARALAETDGLVAVDEFTSVVDRQVAKVASHAVQKAVRREGRRLVAASCHYDIVDWLQPDWVYDVAAGSFAWRSVQPHPGIELRIHPVERTAWALFSRHHYLSASLSNSAHCFGGWIGGQLVGFISYRHFPHARTRNLKMAHRTVVLPDYQGLGIAGRMSDWLGQHLYDQGFRFRYSAAHPAVIAMCRRSPRWQEVGQRPVLRTRGTDAALRRAALDPRRLNTRSFEYTPPAAPGDTLGGGHVPSAPRRR